MHINMRPIQLRGLIHLVWRGEVVKEQVVQRVRIIKLNAQRVAIHVQEKILLSKLHPGKALHRTLV